MPHALDPASPPYLALLGALEEDVRQGRLPAGTRLPPHRTLAANLGISISTVSKAYREAGARGLISGRTGQGTFVMPQTRRDGTAREQTSEINLGFNLAPHVQQRDAIRAILGDLVRGRELDDLFAYRSNQGVPEHRAEIARWLRMPGFEPEPDLVVITNGAQHGIDLAVQMLCRPGEAVLVEELTYIGFRALSSSHHFPILPVAMDSEGLRPDALEAAVAASGARVLYTMPTLQSPTARTMSAARRLAIADIVRKRDLWLIEDDVYSFLVPSRPSPLAGLCPDRAIYLSSFAKIIELGFRVGAMVVPPSLLERASEAVRATAWTTAPLLAEILARMIRSGKLRELAVAVARESSARAALFRRIFKHRLPPPDNQPTGYHAWLPLPPEWNPQDLFYRARNLGIFITPPGSAAVGNTTEPGVRLCLGGRTDRAELERALLRIEEILEHPQHPLLSVI
ncbi:MAG: PLP-dependent aminotransferase family protein [Alphaproteobacteria bacterium]|nr:PLP-dependent aminotransferase family protein [Alphaproteobacteria bacterium]